MDTEEHLLVALVAPGSVEAEVGRLQARLFAAHGLVSVQALPPLIPVSFVAPGARTRGLLPELDRSIRAPWRIRVTGTQWVEGSLYLGVDSAGAWAALRTRAQELCGAEPPSLFPAAEGFFLGCGEAAPEERDRIRPAAPAASFTSCVVALVRIETAQEAGMWWREVYWEIAEQKPLRGRRER
jgi:hypothetical protein